MNILLWVGFGVVAGAIAYLLDTQKVKGGIGAAMVFGVIGALLGGFAAHMLFGLDMITFDLATFIVVITISVLFVFINRTLLTDQENKY